MSNLAVDAEDGAGTAGRSFYEETMAGFEKTCELLGIDERVRMELRQPHCELIFHITIDIKDRLVPYPTMALGTFELSVAELTAAYAGIVSHGQVPEPYFITRVKDSEGKVIFEGRPKVHQALREDVAYLLTHVMEGVCQRGTGAKTNELGAHLAGKTGTTDDYSDAWFIGSSPRITTSMWVGRDMKQRIGSKMTGAEAALPTWMEIVEQGLAEGWISMSACQAPLATSYSSPLAPR